MKNYIISLLLLFSIQIAFSQTEKYDLESQNLHKKVRKTIEHYYKYDKESGGFIRSSVNIKRYNDDGNLAETYSLYNSKFTESKPVKKLYNYNNKGQLIGTKDISDTRDKYSTNLKFIYDSDDNLVKRESVYEDGSTYSTEFSNDSRGRVINKKEYNKDNKITADVNYTYNGDTTTETRTSFNTKDGSIIGTYTTTFKDDKTQLYKSESKYGTSTSTYEYDKYGNVTAVNYNSKTNSKSTYDYEYDKKDNWIKKHYRSGKYQYFYFREIHFDNGDVTGSSDFDPQFVNSLGNFENVAVVPLKKKESTTNLNTTFTTNSSILKNTTWNFDYVYLKKAVKKLNGTIHLTIKDGTTLEPNKNATIRVTFSGNTFTFDFNVVSKKDTDNMYTWLLTNTNAEAGSIGIYKQTKSLNDSALNATFNANGLLSIKEKNGDTMVFYLK